MKRTILAVAVVFAALTQVVGQNKNIKADSIIGEYLVPDAKNGDSKVRFTKNGAGTYDCQVFWLQIPNDPATGKPWLDSKNPDKSLRSRTIKGSYLIKGLKYDSEKGLWDGAKVYDPNRGIRASVTCRILSNGDLQVKGTVLGIGETQNWPRQ